MLLKRIKNISPMRGMPINTTDMSQKISSITGETVQLYYYNSGVLTSDAGQAIGTTVVGQLAYGGIKNALGSFEAVNADTSLTFTSTALTTEAAFDWTTAEAYDEKSGTARAAAIVANLKNGEYVVDYTNGIIYGKKADTSTSLTSASYKIHQTVSGGSSGIASTVNIGSIGGTTVGVTNPMYVRLSDGSAVLSATNPLNVKIGDGTNQVSVIATLNSIKSDLSSYGGAAVGKLNPVFTAIVDSNGTEVQAVAPYKSLKTDISTVNGAPTSSSNLLYTSTSWAASASNIGCTMAFDADGDNSAQALKASAGNVYSLHVYNSNGAATFVQLFNAATGDVNVGTTTPNFVIHVPANGSVQADFNFPLYFSTAITYACTTTPTGSGDPVVGLTLSAAYK